MNVQAPPRLLELGAQSLLRNEALAIMALEELPIELFPPLFMEAFAGRHTEALKAMVVSEMEGVIKLSVPLTVECKDGKNWLEAH